MKHVLDHAKRRFLNASVTALAASAMTPVTCLGAVGRILTPPQSTGPFYPQEIPLDSDNDLVSINGRAEIAKGEITHLLGRVVEPSGRPVANARVEIWQCDANGRYHHPWDPSEAPLDPNFQGYGRFQTGADGAYRFRTIKPVAYPGRAPHIHFAISGRGMDPLVTQIYVADAPENKRDGLLNRIRDRKARESVIVKFETQPDVPKELVARFDIVLMADGRFEQS
jgi:protocatechuate 3,4-dioxygenase beta subunit